jgi:hypothetical protein
MEREKVAGAWVTAQARRRERYIWIGFAAFFLVCAAMLIRAAGHRVGLSAALIFLLAVLAARPYAERYLETHLRWLRGARAERSVGDTLEELRNEGWTIVHNVIGAAPPDMDHVAAGRAGVFLIETKARRYEEFHLARVKRQAVRLHHEVGCWVTPVICLHRRQGEPFRHRDVWIVPQQHMLTWLRERPERAIDARCVARVLDLSSPSL